MSKKTDSVVEKLRNLLHNECKEMSPEEYMEVLESFAGDLEGNIDALKDENPELFE